MPDFERVIDQLELDLASSELEKAQVQGYIAGKRTARLQILIMVVLTTLIWAAVTTLVQGN